jgi:hypothetical protein
MGEGEEVVVAVDAEVFEGSDGHDPVDGVKVSLPAHVRIHGAVLHALLGDLAEEDNPRGAQAPEVPQCRRVEALSNVLEEAAVGSKKNRLDQNEPRGVLIAAGLNMSTTSTVGHSCRRGTPKPLVSLAARATPKSASRIRWCPFVDR